MTRKSIQKAVASPRRNIYERRTIGNHSAPMRDMVKRAVAGDVAMVARVANSLRHRYGLNYPQMYEYVNSVAPIPLAEWDALLGEVESGW